MQNVNFLTPARAWISPKLQELKSKTRRYLPEIAMTSAALFGCLLLTNSFQSLYHEYQAEKYSIGTFLSDTNAAVIGCAGAVILGRAAYAAKEYRKFQVRAQKDREVLTELLQENPRPDQREITLVIKTTHDHNNKFSLENEANRENIRTLSRQLKLEYIEIKTLEDITKKMNSLEEEGKIIKNLIFQGNGNWDRINFAPRSDQDLTKDWVLKSHFPGLADNARILFICDLSGVPDGIAQKFSEEFPEASIYAPGSISYSNYSWVFLDQERKPAMIHFSREKQELITKLFKNNTSQLFPAQEDIQCLVDHISSSPVNSGNRLKDLTEIFLATLNDSDHRVDRYNTIKSIHYDQLKNDFHRRVISMNQGIPPARNFTQINEEANTPNILQNTLRNTLLDFLSLLYNAQNQNPLDIGALRGNAPEAIGTIAEQRQLLGTMQRSFKLDDKFNQHRDALRQLSTDSERLRNEMKLFRDARIGRITGQINNLISHIYLLYLAGKPEDYATDESFIAYSRRIQELVSDAQRIRNDLNALQNSPQPIVLRGIESVITRVRN